MNYKLIIDKNELKGTCYFELLPGKYKEKCWNNNSVFLTEDSITFFEDLLYKVNEKYDHFYFTEYNIYQINELINELAIRLNEIQSNNFFKISGKYFSEEYYNRINKDIQEFRSSIIQMLYDIIDWMKTINENGFTVLGI